MITEKALETNFVNWCKEKMIIAVKGPSALAKGIPDRFIPLPSGGGTIYVEFKGSSYYGLTPIQEWWARYLRDSDPHRYFVIDTPEDLENLKRRVLAFIAIGKKLLDTESQLLADYSVGNIN